MVIAVAWQLDPEAAANVGLRLNTPASAEAFHGFGNDGESHTSPRVLGARVKFFEHAKNPLLIFGRNADAIIFNPDPHLFAFGFPVNINPGCDAGPGEFQRVGKELKKYLF